MTNKQQIKILIKELEDLKKQRNKAHKRVNAHHQPVANPEEIRVHKQIGIVTNKIIMLNHGNR